jgi:hypothetical protein
MTEAFLRPEQKLFLRVVTVTPRKGINWPILGVIAANMAAWYVVFMVGVFAIDAVAKGWWF